MPEATVNWGSKPKTAESSGREFGTVDASTRRLLPIDAGDVVTGRPRAVLDVGLAGEVLKQDGPPAIRDNT